MLEFDEYPATKKKNLDISNISKDLVALNHNILGN